MRQLRTSERSSFKTCRQKWWWGYVEKLRDPNESRTALIFGDMVHIALARYYRRGTKRGPAPAGTFEKLALKRAVEGRVWNQDEEAWDDLVNLGVRMLEGYVLQWTDADQEYEVLSSEQTFQIKVKGLDGKKFMYVGTIDGVWRHLPSGEIRFAEHKTMASIDTAALPFDEQAGGYWAFGVPWLKKQGIIKPDEDLGGIIYNMLRKSAPNPDSTYDEFGRLLNLPTKDRLLAEYEVLGKKLPKKGSGKNGAVLVPDLIDGLGRKRALQLGEPSQRQPPPYFQRELVFRGEIDRQNIQRRVLNELADMDACIADPVRHVYKTPGPLFMSNCKFCEFKDMCELHETGNDWEMFKEATYGTWDPYSDHEIVERR